MSNLVKQLTMFVVAVVVLAPLSACSRCPSSYSAEAIEAQVVDADTKGPLEGVIVTANWELEVGTVGGNVPVGQLMVMETISDEKGRFHFPAWGPKARPRGSMNPLTSCPHLVYKDPQLLLFRRGYGFRRLQNEVVSNYNTGALRKSDWNGKTIELKPFKGTKESDEDHFERLNRNLEHFALDMPEECGWKKIPNAIRVMNRERVRLIRQGVNPNTLSSIDQRLLMNDEYFAKKGDCGSPKAFFEDLQK